MSVQEKKKKVLLVGLSPPGTIEGHVAKCANVLWYLCWLIKSVTSNVDFVWHTLLTPRVSTQWTGKTNSALSIISPNLSRSSPVCFVIFLNLKPSIPFNIFCLQLFFLVSNTSENSFKFSVLFGICFINLDYLWELLDLFNHGK